MRKLILAAWALPLLTACGSGDEPGKLSAEETRQLDEAAAMLDNADDIPVSEDAAANATEQTVIIDPVSEE